MGLDVIFFKFSNEGEIDEDIPVRSVIDFMESKNNVKTIYHASEMIDTEKAEQLYGGECIEIIEEDEEFILKIKKDNGEIIKVPSEDFEYKKIDEFPLLEEIGGFRENYGLFVEDKYLVFGMDNDSRNLSDYIENNIPESNVISIDYLTNDLFPYWKELHNYIKRESLKENTDFIYMSY